MLPSNNNPIHPSYCSSWSSWKNDLTYYLYQLIISLTLTVWFCQCCEVIVGCWSHVGHFQGLVKAFPSPPPHFQHHFSDLFCLSRHSTHCHSANLLFLLNLPCWSCLQVYPQNSLLVHGLPGWFCQISSFNDATPNFTLECQTPTELFFYSMEPGWHIKQSVTKTIRSFWKLVTTILRVKRKVRELCSPPIG